MKFLAVIVLSLSAILAFAQSGDAVFMVKKKAPIYLSQPFDTLFETNVYRFEVVGIDHKEIAEGAMKYGKVLIGDTDIVVIVDTLYVDTLKSILQLYVMEGGKLEPVLAKRFILLRKSALHIKGTEGIQAKRSYNPKSPVFWLRDDTVKYERLKETYAYREGYLIWPVNATEKILSFSVELTCKGISKFNKNNAKTDAAMNEMLALAERGCSIRFYNIRCLRPDLSNDLITMPDHIIRVAD